MIRRRVVIWGAAGHALVLRELVEALDLRLAAVFDNAGVAAPFDDVPLFLGREEFRRWRRKARGSYVGLVAIGGAHGHDRIELHDFMSRSGVPPMTAVHPRAFVAHGARLGAGTQVLANATVAAEAAVGAACIINHGAVVDHECRLEDGVHVAPRAVLAGCVRVGRCSLVGVGAVVLPRIRIGENVIVGAGAVVTRDVPDNAVVYGNPARAARKKTPRGS